MWKWIAVLGIALSTTLSAETKVLAFAGSVKEESVNKKLIFEAAQIARKMGANVTVIDLKDYTIPLFDEDLETIEGMPPMAKKLRKEMIDSDVIFIASPEYNASVAPVLKNAIDWASRGETGGSSRDAFKGKKFAIMAASPGASGGARGLIHLRTIISDIGGCVVPMQVTVPRSYSAFDESGHLKNLQERIDLERTVQEALR